MDISDTLAAVSDQLDAVDLTGGPRIFTITDVKRHSDEQPISISLAEFPRVWRPSKGMRRVLADNWGKDAKAWIGRQVELYCDPDVYFGKDKTGGTRIKRMSHIDKPKTTRINPRGGKSASHTVQPLPQTADTKPPSPVDTLRAEWKHADPERKKAIEAEVAALDELRAASGAVGESDA